MFVPSYYISRQSYTIINHSLRTLPPRILGAGLPHPAVFDSTYVAAAFCYCELKRSIGILTRTNAPYQRGVGEGREIHRKAIFQFPLRTGCFLRGVSGVVSNNWYRYSDWNSLSLSGEKRGTYHTYASGIIFVYIIIYLLYCVPVLPCTDLKVVYVGIYRVTMYV